MSLSRTVEHGQKGARKCSDAHGFRCVRSIWKTWTLGRWKAGDLHIYRRFCQLTWQLGTAGNTCVLILWAQCGLDSGS